MADKSQLFSRAQDYAHSREIVLRLEHTLGYGSDGTVWHSSRDSAVKVMEHAKGYRIEKECYLRLKHAKIEHLAGFNVPALVDFDDSLMIIEIDVVQPPYLLDFGKAYLDSPPPYWGDTQIVANMHMDGRELFGKNWPQVLKALAALRGFGIYYVDPRPGNISFGDDDEL